MQNSFLYFSKHFDPALKLGFEGKMDHAIKGFKRGCNEDGCVLCMNGFCFFLIREDSSLKNINHVQNNIPLLAPQLYEGALRGSGYASFQLALIFGEMHRQGYNACLLLHNYFGKASKNDMIKGSQKETKYVCLPNHCINCKKVNTDQNPLQKCSKCNYYFYCLRECQVAHWYNRHKGECKQHKILKKYHCPHVNKIAIKIMKVQSPSIIEELQTACSHLGLS